MKKVFQEYFKHLSIWLYISMAITFFAIAFFINPQSFLEKTWIILIPVFLAPFFEWWAHKYLLHRIVDPITEPRQYQYMLSLHYKHHWNPNNLDDVFAPVSSAFFVFGLFALPAFFIFGFQGFWLFEGATVAYFLFYEWIHLAHHTSSYKPLTKLGKTLKHAHSWHHHKNENFWWGVTNSFGDHIFGTFKNPKEVEVSPNTKTLGDLKVGN